MTAEDKVRLDGSGDVTPDGDKDIAERDACDAFKVRLRGAFSVADSEYELVSADDIRRRVHYGVGQVSSTRSGCVG